MEDEKRSRVEIVVTGEGTENGAVTVRGRVSALNVEWEIARAPYNSEKLRGYAKFEPENLELAVAVPADGEPLTAVFEQLALALDRGMSRAMGRHLEAIHTPPPEPKGGVRIGGDGSQKEVEVY